MANFLDQNGLQYTLQVLKTDYLIPNFAPKSHNHSASNITSGILTVARGGTGRGTALDACNDFLNALSVGSSTPTDNDYYISQYVNGGTTTTTYHRRPHSALYNYIKGKLDSVYLPTSALDSYLLKTGDTMTGDLTIKKSSASIILQNSTLTDGYYDYKIGNFADSSDNSGFGIAMGKSDGTWVKFLDTSADGAYNITSVDILSNLKVTGAIYEGGTALSSKYQAKGSYLTGITSSSSNTTTAEALVASVTASGNTVTVKDFTGNVGSTKTPIYFKDGVPTALGYTIEKSVPSNAVFTDTNTHYTSKNIVGSSSTATSNAAVTGTGGVYLNHLEESTVKSTHKIVGAGSVKVTSDSSGNITITGTDNNTDTKVTQTVTTSNAAYPLLLAPSEQTTTQTTQTYFDSGVTLNPSTNILSGAKVYESLLQWGGTTLSGSISPIDAALDSQWSTNRLSFMPASDITVEYSTDSGSTWVDYGLTDLEKQSLVTTGIGKLVFMGKKTTDQKPTDKLRVTITAASGKTYFSLKKIFIYLSTQGAIGATVLVEQSKCGSDTTYTTVGTYNVSGWSGWNSIPHKVSFGGGDNQTNNIRRIRMTFGFTENAASYVDKTSFQIINISMHGETSWTNSGGSLASTGHLYSYDINKTATFPAALKATTLYENGTSLTDKYAIKSHASTATTYGVATTSNYGHVKISNGDCNTVSSANGLAAGMDHTHGNYSPKAQGDEFINGTQTNSTNAWTGTTTDSALYDGKKIVYWLPYAGTSTAATLNLTLSGGGTTGAKNVYYGGTSRITTHYPAGSAIRLIYRTAGKIGSNTYEGWWADANYADGNYAGTLITGAIHAAAVINANQLCGYYNNDDFEDASSTDAPDPSTVRKEGYVQLNSGDAINVKYPLIYVTSAIAAGSSGTYRAYTAHTFTLNNFINITTGDDGLPVSDAYALLPNHAVYLIGNYDNNTGKFTPYVYEGKFNICQQLNQTVNPDIPSGNIYTYQYLFLGYATSTTQIYLHSDHPVYYLHQDDTLKKYPETLINGVVVNEGDNVTYYGVCGTDGSDAYKTTQIDNFKSTVGAKVTVKFTDTNSANNPTLNVSGTGAKSIYYKGSAINKSYLVANGTYDFVCTGPGTWELIGDVNTDPRSKNVVGSAATSIANSAVTGTGGVYLNHLEGINVKSSHKIVGAGSVKVTSDSSGNITVTGTDTNYISAKSATTAATAQWYRIASTAASISNNTGIFEITASASGLHTTCIITTGTSYGYTSGTNIQQLCCSHYSGIGISKARIVYHTSYSSKYAYLEVYVPTAVARSISVRSLCQGWSLVAPSTVGSIPSDYTSKTINLVSGGNTYIAPQEANTSSTTVTISSMIPNKMYRYTAACTSITISAFDTSGGSNDYQEYMLEFKAGSNCNLTVPSSVIWINGIAPSFTSGKTYQISIANNLGVWAQFG